MTPMERDIERGLVNMVKRHGGMCLKWVCPGWSGVPDRIVLLPGGRICFVELKRPKGGKVSKLQLWWRDKLRELGFAHAIVYTPEDIHMLECCIVATPPQQKERINATELH